MSNEFSQKVKSCQVLKIKSSDGVMDLDDKPTDKETSKTASKTTKLSNIFPQLAIHIKHESNVFKRAQKVHIHLGFFGKKI